MFKARSNNGARANNDKTVKREEGGKYRMEEMRNVCVNLAENKSFQENIRGRLLTGVIK